MGTDVTALTGWASRLEVPAGSLVVIAGLPGAGKTTLLRRWAGAPGVVALDSEDAARSLAPLALPYDLLRPLVHLLHLIRVLLELRSAAACVLTADPMTSPLRRAMFRFAAWTSGRRLVLVVLDVPPGQAREGQRRRGRTLSARRTRRHERRYRRSFSRALPRAVAVVLSRETAVHADLTVHAEIADVRSSSGAPGALGLAAHTPRGGSREAARGDRQAAA